MDKLEQSRICKVKEIAKILDEEILTDSSKWTQESLFRNKKGEVLHDEQARITNVASVCLMGGFDLACRKLRIKLKNRPLLEFLFADEFWEVTGRRPIGFNDTWTTEFDQVKEALEKVRIRLEEKCNEA